MKRKLVVIGLDTAQHSLIQTWAGDGSLPVLRRLLKQGAFGILESYATYLPGANWPSFYASLEPGEHGIYSHSVWNPQKMKMETPTAEWLPLSPFWHTFQIANLYGLVINIPHTFMLAPFNGIELLSLASDHMLVRRQTNPKEYESKIAAELRRIHYHEEKYDLPTLKEFLQVRDEMIELTHALKDLTIKMMKEEPWDVAITAMPAVHRAGHCLWSTINVRDIKDRAEEEEASDALRQVYIATDQALGEIIKAAGEDSRFLVFSTHGMAHNHSREVILPEMLNRVLTLDEHRHKNRLLKKIRQWIPLRLRHRIKAALPLHMRKRLTFFWRLGQLNWAHVPAFVIPMEVRVGIRINLIGREQEGIVHPQDYEALCRKIIAGLKTFVDADSGKPLIKELTLARKVFKGKRLDLLPDIVGAWNDDSASLHRMITSPLYGDIPWPAPGRNPEGRSGNHADHGFLIAYGEGVEPGAIKDAHVLDLAPTILSMLEKPIPGDMQGRALPILNQDLQARKKK